MYIFNRITVNPQLPKRINKLMDMAYNIWWAWNTDLLKLLKEIDIDLWEQVNKNPVKFLKLISQEKLEQYAKDVNFLKEYDKVVENFVFPVISMLVFNFCFSLSLLFCSISFLIFNLSISFLIFKISSFMHCSIFA